MKIIIFDVWNGSCALVTCKKSWYSMMIDCSSHSEKDENPVEIIKRLRLDNGWLSHMKDIGNNNWRLYPLTLLHITHPDEDHIKNYDIVQSELTPFWLQRIYYEEFEKLGVNIDDGYKKTLCKKYRWNSLNLNDEFIFDTNTFSIPINIIAENNNLNTSIKNNSSILRYINNNWFRVLFWWDMEKEWWKWLIDNDNNFKNVIAWGIDLLVASHHWHTSWYSSELFDLMWAPKLSILSKWWEGNKEWTDVTSLYSQNSTWMNVTDLKWKNKRLKYTLTTRANWDIYLDVESINSYNVYASKWF